MHMPSIDQLPRWGSQVLTVSFPFTRAANELMHDLRRNNPLRVPLLFGFFHFCVHPTSGPRFAASWWVKASYRWSGYDFGLGREEFGSG